MNRTHKAIARRVTSALSGTGLSLISLLLLGTGGLPASAKTLPPFHPATPRLAFTIPPQLDRTSDGEFVRYELRITNLTAELVELQALRVGMPRHRPPLAVLAGERLSAALALDHPGCAPQERRLAPGGECLLYIDVKLPSATPRQLENSLTFRAGGKTGKARPRARLIRTAPAVVGPPLDTGTWAAVHAPEWPRGHRRVFYGPAGAARLPGRFAIDFVRLSPEGSISCGDPDKPSAAIGYGDPVLAVAGGRIAAVRDGVPESASIRRNDVHGAALAAGNYVSLALGNGLFATYEHLRPGSIRVRPGDRVERGAVIGALGFSGDSTGPHLHFHVSTSPDPLGGEGMAFVIDRFTLLGHYQDISQLGSQRWIDSPPHTVRLRRPGSNTVVRFRQTGAGGILSCAQAGTEPQLPNTRFLPRL